MTPRPLLLHGGLVLTPTGTAPADVLVEAGRITAVTLNPSRGAVPPGAGGGPTGQEGRPDRSGGAEVVDVAGRLVTPAFVDAHVHLAATGLAMRGVDLSRARAADEALELLVTHARGADGSSVVLGHGWDETRWPVPRPFTRTDLDRAVGDRPAYVSRVDLHSAVVSTALLRLLDRRAGTGRRVPSTAEIASLAGWSDDGPLTRDAHHAVRGAYHALISTAERKEAVGRALRTAARAGVGSVHELGAPHLSDPDDALLAEQERAAAAARGGALPRVVAYWGERGDLELNRRRGWGAAGDVCVDGAIGSRTAALHEPYVDAPTDGHLYLTVDEVAAHVVSCTEAGLQAGFHAIGDRAVATALAGLQRAAAQVGSDTLRAARHRLEHVEMITPHQVDVLAELAVTASVQPLFDGWWGGPGGLYEQRLGRRRQAMNPFATMHAAGVTTAFGSDSPVTPVAPWAAVRAAVHHSNPDERLEPAAALEAHTRGGWAAARRDGGALEVGAPADLAAWDVADLDRAVDLSADVPRCLLTLVAGAVAHQDADLRGAR